MPTRSDHGYSVKRANEILRGVSIYSGDDRSRSPTDYHVVRVGMKSGGSIEWLATWDQSKQGMRQGEPLSILPASRHGMRLPENTVLMAELTTIGFPSPIRGSSVDLDLSLTGGSTGGRRPLVSSGYGLGGVSDLQLQPIVDAINTSGMAEKVARIPLDDVRPVAQGDFQGRLQRDSTTQISLQRYGGDWVEVDGDVVSITSSGLACLSTDGLLTDSGSISSTGPSANTLYYVYVGSTATTPDQLRLSATAPTLHRGAYYLGTADAFVRRWRFCGWVRFNGSTQFVDTETDRLVVNYYNRLRKSILLRPGYVDDDAATTYTTTSTTWTAANGGTGATASYIASGEDAIHVEAFGTLSNSNAGVTTRIGIGDNSAANASVSAKVIGTVAFPASCAYTTVPATGYRTLVLLVSVSANTGTLVADDARNGSAADPVLTGMYATVLT